MKIVINNKSEIVNKLSFPCIVEWPHTSSIYWMLNQNTGVYLGRLDGSESKTEVGVVFNNINIPKDIKVYHGTITLSND